MRILNLVFNLQLTRAKAMPERIKTSTFFNLKNLFAEKNFNLNSETGMVSSSAARLVYCFSCTSWSDLSYRLKSKFTLHLGPWRLMPEP